MIASTEAKNLTVFKNNTGMDYIYHEKQDGLLCAQHCLNNLLQDSYFTAVDLGTIGSGLDALEANYMAPTGSSSERPSENMDDSGFFSVQVLEKALESFTLSISNLESPQNLDAKLHPEQCKAFICNYDAHWISIRKLGSQWFDLNSLLTAPELISDLHLSMYLTQLTIEGYTIFLVRGVLPDCEADQILHLMKVSQPIKPSLLDPESVHTSDQEPNTESIEDKQMQAAIALSLSGASSGSGLPTESRELSAQELRDRRLKRFDK